jgi:hypothetical protein
MDLSPSLRHVHSRSARANSQVKTVSKGTGELTDITGSSISNGNYPSGGTVQVKTICAKIYRPFGCQAGKSPTVPIGCSKKLLYTNASIAAFETQ